MDQEAERYEGWTSCEVYGHRYRFENDDEVFIDCVDCGEMRDDD